MLLIRIRKNPVDIPQGGKAKNTIMTLERKKIYLAEETRLILLRDGFCSMFKEELMAILNSSRAHRKCAELLNSGQPISILNLIGRARCIMECTELLCVMSSSLENTVDLCGNKSEKTNSLLVFNRDGFDLMSAQKRSLRQNSWAHWKTVQADQYQSTWICVFNNILNLVLLSGFYQEHDMKDYAQVIYLGK